MEDETNFDRVTPLVGMSTYFRRRMGERDSLHPIQIREKIGHGGMADVHLAEADGIYVVVKILRASVDEVGGTDHERFRQEAHILSELVHTNIIRFCGAGILETRSSEVPFFVTEYHEGDSLAQVLRNLREERRMELGDLGERTSRLSNPLMPISMFREIAFPVNEAIAFAHERGVIHRDLKPHNIMLDRDGNSAQNVRVLDFGIAKIRSSRQVGKGLTKTGMFLGTVYYMSPEQIRNSNSVDASTDVFSLGVLFLEMLTGSRPGGTREDMMPVATYVMTQSPVAGYDVTKYAKGVPEALRRVLMKATCREPQKRYGNAGELLSAMKIAFREIDGVETARTQRLSASAPTFVRSSVPPQKGSSGLGFVFLTLALFATVILAAAHWAWVKAAYANYVIPFSEGVYEVVVGKEIGEDSVDNVAVIIEDAPKRSEAVFQPQRPPTPSRVVATAAAEMAQQNESMGDTLCRARRRTEGRKWYEKARTYYASVGDRPYLMRLDSKIARCR